MKRIKLFDRSEEIYNQLPKEYADIILNSIIAKSLQNVVERNEGHYVSKSQTKNERKKEKAAESFTL